MRFVLIVDLRGESHTPRNNAGLLSRPRAALRRYFFFSTGLGFVTLGLAIIVSFLAVSATSEARAPGVEDSVAVTTEKNLAAPLAPSLAKGPSSIFLEPELVLSIQERNEPPPAGTTVPDLLASAPRRISPPPPQAPLGTPLVTAKGPIDNVNITFYDCANQGFCGHMANGEVVYEGVAACSWNLPIGTAFYILGDPTQRIYVCKDRGLLDDTWVDIFWYHPDDGYNWQSQVGRYGTIFIVYLPG